MEKFENYPATRAMEGIASEKSENNPAKRAEEGIGSGESEIYRRKQ